MWIVNYLIDSFCCYVEHFIYHRLKVVAETTINCNYSNNIDPFGYNMGIVNDFEVISCPASVALFHEL